MIPAIIKRQKVHKNSGFAKAVLALEVKNKTKESEMEYSRNIKKSTTLEGTESKKRCV